MRTDPHFGREPDLAAAFVHLADTLVDDFDLIEMLDELSGYCVEFLDISAAGLLLIDRQGNLEVAGTSAEQSQLIELFAAQGEAGPCVDCIRDGREVLVPNLVTRDVSQRWPTFARLARLQGYHAAHVVPMRLRDLTIGALALFDTTPTALSRPALRVGQALADVATIAILQYRAIADHSEVNDQLQHALTSRIAIEQATGRLSQHHGIPLDAAFQLMRSYARRHNLKLSDLAHTLATGTDVHPLLTH